MRLTELEPRFLKIIDDRTHQYVEALADADGIMFMCPKCWTANGGPVGTHQVICWRPHVPQTRSPVPGRWQFEGTGYHDLTLKAGSSSVLLTGDNVCLPRSADGKLGPGWHGFITNGEVS